MIKWGKQLEESWFSFIDCIFVATNFHKELIQNTRIVQCPIYVTGLPIYDTFSNSSIKKEKIIVFPHRLDSEKQPEEFDRLQTIFQEKYPNLREWKFIKTKLLVKSKQQYYDLLNKSTIAISTALQETWGIAMQEALFAGCIPFVPNRLSYKEMYPSILKYDNIIDLVAKLETFICNELGRMICERSAKETRKNLKEKGEKAIPKMIKCIKELI